MAQAPKYPDFPQEEFQNRYTRARELMMEKNIDALLVTAEQNYVYFTGHRSPQNVADRIRPYVVLLPRDREPVVFVMPFEEGAVRLTTWISDVRPYQLLRHNEMIVETLQEFGLAKKRIGCELGREQFLELSHNDFVDLQGRLSGASLVDASEVLLGLRAVKSPAEVERIRAAMRTASRAVNRAFVDVKPGMTNLDLAKLIKRRSIEEGADKVVTIFVDSGRDFTKGIIGTPVPRPMEVGDTVTIDLCVEQQGYCSDIARTAAVGKASSQQRDMYRFVFELNHKCYEALRPGNLCEDAVLLCRRELARVGRKTMGVGRIGHGVGRDGAEYPSLALGEKVPLEPGMTLACNPNFTTEYGFFNVEETLLVTGDAPEILPDPRAPAELPVLGE